MENQDLLFFTEKDGQTFQKFMDKLNHAESDIVTQNIFNEMLDYFDNLHERMQKKYILSCNGDFDIIVNDIKYMLTQVTKKEFQEHLQDRRESLPTEEFLLKRYETLPEPERSEKIKQIPQVVRMSRQASKGNFRNACNYISGLLRISIEALEYYHFPMDFVRELVEEKAGQWYKKPGNIGEISVLHAEKSARQASKAFYDMPDSPASHLLADILTAGGNIAELPSRKKQINHSAKYSVLQKGSQRLVSMENKNSTLTVEIEDISKLVRTGMRFFILSMIKANEQILHDGKISREYITFSLQELIDKGMYSSVRSARRGFLTARDALTSLKVRGEIPKGRKKTSIDDLSVLFIRGRIENNQCYLYMNPYVDWNFLAQYFTKIPKYFFALSDNSAKLLYYIFYLARQNTQNIAEKGCFSIKFRAIHNLLMLPSEKGNPKPQETIRTPIEKAICEIETEHSRMYGNQEFSMLSVYDEKMKISEYLDEGYLKIYMKGAFATDFISLHHQKRQKIMQAQKQKTRITEKAVSLTKAETTGDEEKNS